MILTSCLLLALIHHGLGEPEKFTEINEDIQLHNDLLLGYKISEPPSNFTDLELFFILNKFFFDNEEVSFTTKSYVYLNWTDERLKWNPSDHAGISVTQINFYKIWTPDLEDVTGFEYNAYIGNYMAPCQIKNTGAVTCLHDLTIQSSCSTDLSNWPYDLQSCFLKLELHNINNKEAGYINVKVLKGLSSFSSEHGPGWDLIRFNRVMNISDLQLYFTVERNAAGLTAMVIAPSVVLSVLTITSLFLNTGNIRVGIVILSLLIHLRLLHVFSEVVPKHGSTVPSALRFLNNSIVYTVIAVGLSFLLSHLRRKKLPAPRWVCIVNEFVFKGPARFLVWPRWEPSECESVDTYNKAVEDWTEFANVINSVALILSIILYLSIYSAYIPHEVPHDLIKML